MLTIRNIQYHNGQKIAILSDGRGVSHESIEGEASVNRVLKEVNGRLTVSSGVDAECETWPNK